MELGRIGNIRKKLKGWNRNIGSAYRKEKLRLSKKSDDIDKNDEHNGLSLDDRELHLD
jgi:hypothetical protein